MSRKTALKSDLIRVGNQLGGAHLTREAREATFSTFANTMHSLGYGIQRADQIGGRHLGDYVTARKEAGRSPRTIANELSHIRAVLTAVAKAGLARNPAYSNRALEIERASRSGTKKPILDSTIKDFQLRMDQLGRPDIGAVLELQRALGLRAAEAIRGGQRDTLGRWERELSTKGLVRVVDGTKGGKPRDTHPADQDRALAAVRSALAILDSSGQRYLVTREDGTTASNLRQAMNIYKNICHREGVQSHSARYAFARERVAAYLAQGFSLREARAATSLDLGHGDARGRYIAQVYVRES